MRLKKNIKENENPCWDGYEMVGMKLKDGKEVPNCVPKNEVIGEKLTSLPGEWVSYIEKSKSRGKKLMGVFKTARAAKMWLNKNSNSLLNRDDVERVGTMTKKEWDETEAKWAVENVNESKYELKPNTFRDYDSLYLTPRDKVQFKKNGSNFLVRYVSTHSYRNDELFKLGFGSMGDTSQAGVYGYTKNRDWHDLKLNKAQFEKLLNILDKNWKSYAKSFADFYKGKDINDNINEMNVNKKFGSKYDIGAGSMGNGTTFWNRAQEVRGDYKTIAHVSDEGKVTFYDKKLPNDVKKHIEDYAKTKTEVREGKINEDVKFKDGDYEFISKSGYSIVTYKGNTIADGNFDRDSDAYWLDHSSFKSQKPFDDGKEALKYFKSNRIISESNTVNEVKYRFKIKTKNGESFTTRVYNSKKEADDAHWKYAKDNRFKSIELVTETLGENELTIKTLKESHPFSLKKYISESVNENTDSKPTLRRDKSNPNFIYITVNYPTGSSGSALSVGGKDTMSGSERKSGSEKSLKMGNEIAKKLKSKYNIEDITVTDEKNGKVVVFAVSDDFINTNDSKLKSVFESN